MVTENKLSTVEKEELQQSASIALKTIRETQEDVGSIKKAVMEGHGFAVEKFKKAEEEFSKVNDRIEKIFAEKELLEKQYKDLEEKTEQMARLYHSPSSKSENSAMAIPEVRKFVEEHREIFKKYISRKISLEDNAAQKFSANSEIANYPQIIKSTLNTYNNIDGGFLMPHPMSNQILEPVLEISPIRQYATTIQMASKDLTVPSLISRPSSFWVGENQSIGTSQPQFGQEVLNTRKLGVIVQMTSEMMEDAVINIEAYVAKVVREEFSRAEGAAFVNGSDDNYEPEGLMTNTLIPEEKSGDANELTFDSIKLIQKKIKDAYDPRYAFNRRTRVDISILKDGQGNYLWQQGNVVSGVAATIDGYPYFIANDFDDVAASNYPVLFGDFRFYWIGDRTGVTVLRDPYSNKTLNVIDLLFIRRLAAKVMLAEAFAKIKISV